MSEVERGWRALARSLHERGGVPERRAQAVALRSQGLTYREIAAELGVSDHSSVRKQVEAYRETRKESVWLAEYGPDL